MQNYELKKAIAGYEATALKKNQLKLKTNRTYIVYNFLFRYSNSYAIIYQMLFGRINIFVSRE